MEDKRLTFKSSNLIFIILTLMVALAIYFQAVQPLWRWHLEMDVFAFFEKVEYFAKYHTFSGIPKNEYLPGAVWFFLLVSFFVKPLVLANYYPVLFAFNFIFFTILASFYKKFGSFINALLFLGATLVSGPYLFYRFELLAALLVVLSLVLYKKGREGLSYFVLGLSTMVKLYPVIILPYYLLVSFKTYGWRRVFRVSSMYLVGCLLSVGAFMLAGGSLEDMARSLNYHSVKPIGVESIPATVITLKSLILNGFPPKIALGNSVWGLVGNYNLSVFGWLWIFPVGIIYMYLISKREFCRILNVGVVFLMLLTFLVFSKNLNPQYLFWFMSIFPLIKIKSESGTENYLVLFSLILLISYLNQCVYPLLFSELLGKFFNDGTNYEIFYLQLLKNVALVILLGLSARYVLIKKSIE